MATSRTTQNRRGLLDSLTGIKPGYTTIISDEYDSVEGIGRSPERAREEAAFHWREVEARRQQQEEQATQQPPQAQTLRRAERRRERSPRLSAGWTRLVGTIIIAGGFIAGAIIGGSSGYSLVGILISGAVVALILAIAVELFLSFMVRFW